MIVNFCAARFRQVFGNWDRMYGHVANSFNSLGYEVRVSKYLNLENIPSFASIGIEDSYEHVYVYNHTNTQSLNDDNLFQGKRRLFIKPTGPTPEHFTIDTLGYAAHSEITYTKPPYSAVDSTEFFSCDVPKLIASRCGKWTDRRDLVLSDTCIDIPNDHILVLGQIPHDETVTRMSFGGHWQKLKDIVAELENQESPVVIKLHPQLESEVMSVRGTQNWYDFISAIKLWKYKGHTVLYGNENLHDVLPKTRVAITENSTSGIDCLIYDIPIISYGYPEYHWITFDLRHLIQLQNAVSDLSWWDKSSSRQWLSWYCTQYQCYDSQSTLRRLKDLL